MQSGWKAGDKAGWEAQLKARQQYGQNEYSRTQTK
jgi:membrane-bound lytic murein transglycosylase B